MFLAFATRCVAFLNVSKSKSGSLPAQCEVARSDPDTIRGLSGPNLAGPYWSIHETHAYTRARRHAACPTGTRRQRLGIGQCAAVGAASSLHDVQPLSAAALSIPRLSSREIINGSLADRPSKVGSSSGSNAPDTRIRPVAEIPGYGSILPEDPLP